jgi:hypothetical protein
VEVRVLSSASGGPPRRRAGHPGLEPGIAGFGDRSLCPIWPVPRGRTDGTGTPGAGAGCSRRRECEHTFVYALRSSEAFTEVKALVGDGLSDYAIARRTGVPRSTVQHWRRRETPPAGGRRTASDFEALDPDGYAYLLGAYLGDGTIWATGRRTWRLAIYCDAAYPQIIREIGAAISRLRSKGVSPIQPQARSRGCRDLCEQPPLGSRFSAPGAGTQARAKDSARSLAASDHQCSAPISAQGADPFGRLSYGESLPDRAAQRSRRRVRLSALLLHQPLGRHPGDLLRALRSARDSLDAVESPQHLGLASHSVALLDSFVGPKG